MSAVSITVVDQPSKSKGWARYALSVAGSPVLKSSTGNRWVSASHSGEAQDGAELVLEVETMNRQGKMSREERRTERFTLIVDAAATAEIESRPMAQGMRLRVAGARVR